MIRSMASSEAFKPHKSISVYGPDHGSHVGLVTARGSSWTWNRAAHESHPRSNPDNREAYDTFPCLWTCGFIANRRELTTRMGQGADNSDSALLLHLYNRFGCDAARYIAGPFAWVLWDEIRQQLVAVRDRLGSYGFCYAVVGSQVHFAPRADSLVSALSPALNPGAIAAQIRGEAPPPGATFFNGINSVEAGSLVVITRERITVDRYWQIEPRPLLRMRDDASYAEAFRALFLPLVREYGNSAAVGVTLSGGLDSSSVAASFREAEPGTRLTAFSWVSPDLPQADESLEIRAAVRNLRCELVTIPAGEHWPLRSDPGIRAPLSSPFFNFYTDLWEATFRAVRERGLRVLFTGLGGDHLFGGNVFSYPDLLLTGRWVRLGSELKAHLPSSELDPLELILTMMLKPVARALRRSDPTPRKSVSWMSERLNDSSPEGPFPPSSRILPGRQQRLRTLRDPLLPVIVESMTATAARFDVELRHPLLDHRLFEFAASLPTTQTFAAGERKIILRNAMRGLLPDEVIGRRNKVYINALAERGLRERETVKVWALMTDMRAAAMGFVDEARLRQEYHRYLEGKTNRTLFWYTITLENWLRQHFS